MKSILKNLLVAVIIALAISLVNLNLNGLSTVKDFFIDLAINLAFSIALTGVNVSYFNWLNTIYSWGEHAAKRLIYGALGSVLLSMMVLFVLQTALKMVLYDQSFLEVMTGQKWNYYTFGLIVTFVVSLAFHAVYFYKELQSRKVKEQKVIAGTATAQFDALKSQLDPHFLFNSLNVLVSLIEENPKAATKFTTSLSKVYRYVLEQRNKQMVSVDEELKFARTYVSLLQMRFEDSLTVDMPATSRDPEGKVVPLSLQLLLENAVKHNIVSDKQPLHLEIYEKNGHLVVANNLQKKEAMGASSGVGLQNIISRYALVTDNKIAIHQTREKFEVSIPIVENPTIMKTINPEDLNLLKAKEKVAELKDFYAGLIKGAVILTALATINYVSGGFPWVIFPTIGITLGLAYTYLRTFDQKFFLGKGWENRKIEELMNDNNF